MTDTYVSLLQELAALPQQVETRASEAKAFGADRLATAEWERRSRTETHRKIDEQLRHLRVRADRLIAATAAEPATTTSAPPTTVDEVRRALTDIDRQLRSTQNSVDWVARNRVALPPPIEAEYRSPPPRSRPAPPPLPPAPPAPEPRRSGITIAVIVTLFVAVLLLLIVLVY